MTYYWGLYIITTFIAIIAYKNQRISNRLLYVIISLIFLFFAFREGFTPDYYAYEVAFSGDFLNERHDKEFGYLYLTSFLSYENALIIQTLLLCLCIYIAFKNYIPIKYWWFALTILFIIRSCLLGNMGAFRSSFVTMAFFISIILRLKYKLGWIWGLAIMLLFSTIHLSGIMFIPLMFISSKPFKRKTYTTLIIISVVLIFVSLFLTDIINNFSNVFINAYFTEYSTYMEGAVSSDLKLNLFVIIKLILMLWLFYTSIQSTKNKFHGIMMSSAKLTSIYFMLDLLPGIGLISRLKYYLFFPFIIGNSYIIYSESNQKKRLLHIGALLLYAFFDMYMLYQTFYFKDTYGIYHNTLLGI